MIRIDHPMEVVRRDGAVIVRFADTPLDLSNCDSIFGEILRIANREHPMLLIMNLQRLTYLHSIAIGRLLDLQKQIKAYGGEMKLCSLAEQAHETLSITRVDRLLEIVDFEPVSA